MLYGDKFCSTREKHRIWQNQLGFILAEKFKIKSVIDFGCSIGTLLEGFQKAGCEIKGYDISHEYAINYAPARVVEFLTYGNVCEKMKGVPESDCAISIEVAEHIESQFSTQFIDNLCSCNPKFVFLSAAPPGQGGVGHINCVPHQYWINLLKDRGFTKLILPVEIRDLKAPTWIRINFMGFRNENLH